MLIYLSIGALIFESYKWLSIKWINFPPHCLTNKLEINNVSYRFFLCFSNKINSIKS